MSQIFYEVQNYFSSYFIYLNIHHIKILQITIVDLELYIHIYYVYFLCMQGKESLFKKIMDFEFSSMKCKGYT
jgi:hypothetical protein